MEAQVQDPLLNEALIDRRPRCQGLRVQRVPHMALRAQELCEARHGFTKSTQKIASKYSVINHSTQLLASILRSHVWLRKALKPGGQTMDCCTTGWSPSIGFQPPGSEAPSTHSFDIAHEIDNLTVTCLPTHRLTDYECLLPVFPLVHRPYFVYVENEAKIFV